MIVELAILTVKAGQNRAFEQALRGALPLIEATPGFLGIEVRPCIENTNQYLLLVSWEKLEDHTLGFRELDRYPKWRAALHHFYEGTLTVLHYSEPV